jgi:hypothetical protein
MFTIPLTNSKLLVEVSEEDHLHLTLYGPWYYGARGYARATRVPHDFIHHMVIKRMGFVITDEVDHIDRNTMNNRRDNLRLATSSEQKVNRGMISTNTTGYKCIYWHTQRLKWYVHVYRNKKAVHVGLYKTIEEAIQQRDAYLKRNNLTLVE